MPRFQDPMRRPHCTRTAPRTARATTGVTTGNQARLASRTSHSCLPSEWRTSTTISSTDYSTLKTAKTNYSILARKNVTRRTSPSHFYNKSQVIKISNLRDFLRTVRLMSSHFLIHLILSYLWKHSVKHCLRPCFHISRFFHPLFLNCQIPPAGFRVVSLYLE